jgi:predicted Zn finger-like uncharacterized protein
MILTCPACDTKYVVKDGAIPPGGRQVRCASCKHSWHQDPDEMPAEPATAADIDLGGPPPPQPDMEEQPLAEAPAEAEAVANIASEPQPGQEEESPWGAISSEPVASTCWPWDPPERGGGAPAVADDGAAHRRPMAEVSVRAPAQEEEEEFVGYAPIAGEQGDRGGAGR